MNKIISYLKTNSFSTLSRLIAIYFIWAFHLHVGFPPITPLNLTSIIYLILFVFFFVLPFAQRFKFGELIEFETKIERVRADVKEVRSETRELISTVSTVANAISTSINQNVVVNLPGKEEEQAARDELLAALTQSNESTRKQREFQEYWDAVDSDVNYALARLRMDLEREIRRILGKNLETGNLQKSQRKFLSARSLFLRLVSTIPRYKPMQSSFDYILHICNAAIHGRQIPENVGRETLDMGLRLLQELENEVEP